MARPRTNLLRRPGRAAPDPGTAGLYALPSPFPDEAGTVFLLEPPEADAADLAGRLQGGLYRRPFLLEHGGVRCLHFSLGFTQSALRLAEPEALHLAYTRAMMSFLLFLPRPRHVLLLGLGGGALVRFCRRHLPATRITAVEVDPDVVAYRKAFRLPPDGEDFRVVVADGARHLAESPERHDVILVDAFDREGVVPAMAGEAFFADAHARLSGRGVLVMNLAGKREAQAEVLPRLRAAFAGRVLTLSLRAEGNRLAFAFRDPLFAPRWPWLKSAARDLGARLGLDLHAFAGQMERESR